MRNRDVNLRTIISLVAIFLISACTPSKPVGPIEKKVVETQAALPNNLVISFTGFFNSERREFSPVPIGYAGIDYDIALNAMKDKAEELGYVVAPFGVVDKKVITLVSEEDVTAAVDAMLAATNNWLQTADASCSNCSSIPGFQINLIEDYEDWGKNDKFVFVWGLETLAPNSSSLRSGLGAFMFDASGSYHSHTFKEYNFSNYTTEPFTNDLVLIMNEIDKTLN